MNREHILNDYTEELTDKENTKNDAEDYVYKLEERLNGTKSLYEVVIEVNKFLERVDVPDKVYKDITKICNGFNENTNAIMARKQLLMYLDRYEADKEDDYNKSKDTVSEIKDEFIDKQEKKLNDVGIDITGDKEELKDELKDEADVEKVEDNVDNAVEHYEAIRKADDSKERLEIDYHDLTNAINTSGDETIVDAAVEDNMSLYKTNNPMGMNLRDDGTISIEGDSNNPSSMNYAAMLTLMLVTNDPELSLRTNFDMIFSKDAQDKSKFSMIFGDFPVEKHQDRKVNDILMAKINRQAELYDKGNDYINELALTSPELKEVFVLINESVLGREGTFKMAVRNDGTTHDLALGFDDNYSDIGKAFEDNGASLGTIAGDKTSVHLSAKDKAEQVLILTNTNETLKIEKTKELTKEESYQKVLIPNGDAANVDTKFLQVLVVANILMLIVLIALIILTIVK